MTDQPVWQPAAAQAALKGRAQQLAFVRGFFSERQVLEVETPVLARHGVTENELNDAKTYLTGAYPLRFSESGRIAHMLLGIQFAPQVDQKGV